LQEFAAAYARPIVRRKQYVADANCFAAAYLGAFAERFTAIQQEYGKRRRAYDNLFPRERGGEDGSFANRWQRVLARMQRTNVESLATLIKERCA